RYHRSCQLFRDRPDGRGVSCQLPGLVRPRAHRAHAGDRAHVQGARAAGGLPRRVRGAHPLSRAGPLRRPDPHPLLRALAGVAALLRDALGHARPAVRRQAALAAGRIGDPAAVDLLVAALRDSDRTVQAAAAFALGLLKDPRAVEPLAVLVRAVAPAQQGAPEVEAVTALAKIGGD